MSYILQHVSDLTEQPSGRWILSGEEKHPRTAPAYTFIDVVYIKIRTTVDIVSILCLVYRAQMKGYASTVFGRFSLPKYRNLPNDGSVINASYWRM